jgi:hypothetical protein
MDGICIATVTDANELQSELDDEIDDGRPKSTSSDTSIPL